MPAPPSDHYKPTTLTAWTAARRAAAARLFRIKQAAAIEEQASREEKEEAESKSKEGSSRPKRPKPHEVHAANLVDDFVKERTPQLVLVLETFAPVHQSLPAMLILHFFYWWSAPWYLHFLLPYPIIYLVPMWCTVVSLLRWEDQDLWQAYWAIMAVVEYVEFLMFGNTITLTWWPKLKAVLCFLLYSKSLSDKQEAERMNSHREKVKYEVQVPVYAALQLIKLFLPDPPRDVEGEKDEKARNENLKEQEKLKEEAEKKREERKAKEKLEGTSG